MPEHKRARQLIAIVEGFVGELDAGGLRLMATLNAATRPPDWWIHELKWRLQKATEELDLEEHIVPDSDVKGGEA